LRAPTSKPICTSLLPWRVRMMPPKLLNNYRKN
jgi:hypothetical protein